ncbi:MAG: hypothetical protein KBT46_01255 [Ruminococcus sp.]|nr:hypothetical protein [Candidatus Copronaster equi]
MQFYTKTVKEAGISYRRFAVLYNTALEYPELMKRKNLCYDLSRTSDGGSIRGSGTASVTERKAEAAIIAGKKIDIINGCLKKAVGSDTGIFEPLRQNICYGIPFIQLAIPCGVNSLTKFRNRFFILLDREIE